MLVTDHRRHRVKRRRARRGRMGTGALIAIVVMLVVTVGYRGHSSPARSARIGSAQASALTPQPVGRTPVEAPPARPAGALRATSPAERRLDHGIDAILRYTPFVTAGGGHRREIALTFDDGPSPYTSQVLRILRADHVPATFFVVGQQLSDFSAHLRQELGSGQSIGDHTENHAWLSHLSAPAQLRQIRDDALRLTALGAPFPRLVRPPYGAFNRLTLAVTRFTRMLLVLWSVDTEDWARPGAATIIRRALSGARPGAVVLMHDGGGDRSQTVAALPAIITALRRRGYRLVTVPRLLLDDPPPRGRKPPSFTGG